MQNTFFLLFVLIRQRFYKIVSHIISTYFQEVYPTLCNQLLIFSHRDIVASLGNLNWPSTESGENFPSLDNILLWPRAEARPWVFDTISSGMGKLLRNYRLLIVNKRSRQEKTRHFCQGNITRLWVWREIGALEREAHVSFSHLLSDRPQDNSMLSLPRWQPFLSLHAMTQKQSMRWNWTCGAWGG